jgi:phosphatidylglycerol:prolipoprotein diacylglycerol transferase
MHPVLLTVGGIDIHGYGVAGALGFILMCALSLNKASDLGVPRERVADLIFWTSLFALMGARGVYVLQNLEQFHSLADVINLRRGGLVFYGSMFVGLPAAFAWCWYYGLSFIRTLDVFSVGLPLAHGISRVGCLMAGCCWGRPTDLPWGVTYSDPVAPAPHGIALHPTQLYEALYLIVVAAVCGVSYSRRRFEGQVAATYLGMYALFRPLNELLRDDPERGWFLEPVLGQSLTLSQGLSILVGLAAAALLAFAWRRSAAASPTRGQAG